MEIEIGVTTIEELVIEELSHIADQAYGDNGTSLYDNVNVTSKDAGLTARFINDAIDTLIGRNADIAAKTADGVAFDVPDIPDFGSSPLQAEVERFVMLYASAGFLAQRRPALVPDYTTRIQTALDNISNMLRTRTTPTRT